MSKQIKLILLLVLSSQIAFGRRAANLHLEKLAPVNEIELKEQQAKFVAPKWRKNADKRTISKPFRALTIPELEYNLKVYLRRNQGGDKESAINYLERLIAKYGDFAKIRDARLQLADLYFDRSNFTKAGEIYAEYFEAYPGHIKAEYALWRSILAKSKEMGACDQDNTVTSDIIELGQKYLSNRDYKKYRKQLGELLSTCENQLFESEVQIFENYLKQGRVSSATRRLNQMQASKKFSNLPQTQTRLNQMSNLLDQVKSGKNPLRLLKRSKSERVSVASSPALSKPKVQAIDYANRF